MKINYIFNSCVCPLGRIVFYLWSILLLAAVLYKFKYIKYLNILAVITVIITVILNKPLFIRSIPAFLFLFLTIN